MKWETKEGKEIDIKDMTNSHLINAMKHIEKKDFTMQITQESILNLPFGTEPDDLESEIDLRPIYNEMRMEMLERRVRQLEGKNEMAKD